MSSKDEKCENDDVEEISNVLVRLKVLLRCRVCNFFIVNLCTGLYHATKGINLFTTMFDTGNNCLEFAQSIFANSYILAFNIFVH